MGNSTSTRPTIGGATAGYILAAVVWLVCTTTCVLVSPVAAQTASSGWQRFDDDYHHYNIHASVLEMTAPNQKQKPAVSIRRGLQQTDNNNNTGNDSNNPFSDEFTIGMELIWSMSFTNDTEIQGEPTEEDYQGLLSATMLWLMESVQEAFQDQSDVLVLQRIRFTRYLTAFSSEDAINDPSSFPSTFAVAVMIDFGADHWYDLPSGPQFLVLFSSQFDRVRFVNDFLSQASPSTSIFRSVDQLRYSIKSIPPEEMTATATTTTTVSFPTEFRIDIGFGIPDRQPTEDEYSGFMNVTNAWFTDVFQEAYPSEIPSNNTMPTPSSSANSTQFVRAEGRILFTTFNPTVSGPLHTVTVLLDVVLENASSSGGVELDDLIDILQAADLDDYRVNYLHEAEPQFSIFSGATSVSLW